jgi:hypothetical protein
MIKKTIAPENGVLVNSAKLLAVTLLKLPSPLSSAKNSDGRFCDYFDDQAAAFAIRYS